MIDEKLAEVLSKEGVVSIVSHGDGEAHVCNTWNSYIVVKDGNKFLIPAYAMRRTERNTTRDPAVKLTLGSREVMGHRSMGAGFLIQGKARFVAEGPDWDMMKAKFGFLTRVLEVTVGSVQQTL